MASVEHPIGQNLARHRAFAERVVWQMVGIINCKYQMATSPGGTAYCQGIGTGSAFRWKNKYLILTAKHVLEDAGASDLRFLLRPSGQLGDWATRFERPELSERVEFAIDRIVMSPRYDLAAIILGSDPSGRAHLQYCQLPSGLAPVPTAGSGVFLAGYPSDLTVTVASRVGADGVALHALGAIGYGCWTTVVDKPPRFFPSSYDPDLHFLLEFDPAKESSKPQGYSGAGVWYQGQGSSEVWAARPVLAGLQTGWHAESKLMISIRSEVIGRFLEERVDGAPS